jgi:hypothetical protein
MSLFPPHHERITASHAYHFRYPTPEECKLVLAYDGPLEKLAPVEYFFRILADTSGLEERSVHFPYGPCSPCARLVLALLLCPSCVYVTPTAHLSG